MADPGIDGVGLDAVRPGRDAPKPGGRPAFDWISARFESLSTRPWDGHRATERGLAISQEFGTPPHTGRILRSGIF
ncbi:MAG: hypothetical protein IIC92_08140 [Chloroflexi bacterium]|nr:hypothetical protein [Chloroflexota bacterium]